MNQVPKKALWIFFLWSVLALACNRSVPERSDDASGTRLEGPGIVGVVKDEAGRNVEGALVLGCTNTACPNATTDVNGRFYIGGYETPVDVAVKIPEDEGATPPCLETITPVRLVDESVVDVGTLYVPVMPAPVRLGLNYPQTVELSDGLILKLHSRDINWPLTAISNDRLAARLLTPSQIPKFPELGAEKVLAVYAFFPFGTRSKSKIAVRFPTKVPAGTKVRLRTIGDLDGRLSPPEAGTSDGKFILSDPGAGITDLTWLVVSQ